MRQDEPSINNWFDDGVVEEPLEELIIAHFAPTGTAILPHLQIVWWVPFSYLLSVIIPYGV